MICVFVDMGDEFLFAPLLTCGRGEKGGSGHDYFIFAFGFPFSRIIISLRLCILLTWGLFSFAAFVLELFLFFFFPPSFFSHDFHISPASLPFPPSLTSHHETSSS